MTSALKTITYPVSDLAKAKARFGALLGAEPYIDQPYYVAFSAGGQDLGLDPNGHARGFTGPVPFWHVEDLDASLQALVDAGSEVVEGPKDVGGGNRIVTVKDPDGNLVGLIQAA
jgi:predicted enzyme related to lactoylglutathione lyase